MVGRLGAMAEVFRDRRRTPRVTVAAGHQFGLPISLTVQLLELSLSGVLLLTSEELEIGRRGHLRTMLGSDPLDIQIEVRRSGLDMSAERSQRRFRIGAAFVALDDVSRRSIQRFLTNHSESNTEPPRQEGS